MLHSVGEDIYIYRVHIICISSTVIIFLEPSIILMIFGLFPLQELQEMIDEADRDGDGGEAQRNDGDGGEARGFQERLSHVT